MGVTTAEEVCNLALTAIGHTDFIGDLTDESTEAEVAAAIYETARDATLERVQWKFATLRALLVEIAGETRDGWEYVYALPANCIAPRAIVVAGDRAPSPELRTPFEIEGMASISGGAVDGICLLTDQESAELIYTARVVAPGRWSPLFVDALAWKLAVGFALGLAKKPAVAAAMEAKYERALAIAAASQFRQSREDRPPPSEFISVRD